MINFPRMQMKKLSGLLESSSPSASSVPSLSSYKKSDSYSSSLSTSSISSSSTSTSTSTSSSSKKKKKKKKNRKKDSNNNDNLILRQQGRSRPHQVHNNMDPIDTTTNTNTTTTTTNTNTTHSNRNDMPITTITRPNTVRFEKTAKVKRVRPLNQYSVEEQEDIWYTESEYTDIKRRVVITVKMMMRNDKKKQQYQQQNGGSIDSSADDSDLESVENDDHTIRGLECRTRKAALQRKGFKMYARDLVLDEQENQIDSGMRPNMIRKAYLEASIISLKKAQAYGRMDEDTVKNGNNNCLQEILNTIKLEHNERL
jgi:hypothetical protein